MGVQPQAAHTPWGPLCTFTAALAPARRCTAPREQTGVLVKVGGGILSQITSPPQLRLLRSEDAALPIGHYGDKYRCRQHGEEAAAGVGPDTLPLGPQLGQTTPREWSFSVAPLNH